MNLAFCYTNFGPYHLARLRALAERLAARGDSLLAYELADREERYPWDRSRADEPFRWTTLFPGRSMESISRAECVQAMTNQLDRDQPDALGVVGYSRPESMAMLRWGLRHGRPAILMNESQEIDHPRAWWREAVKARRVRRFSACVAGGPRHRDYAVKLGVPFGRVTLGNNAVDNAWFAARSSAFRHDPATRVGLPARPYFVAANRFVPEKNLARLVRAYAAYRAGADPTHVWDLVLCGDGPEGPAIEALIAHLGLTESVHRPGFVQAEGLTRWLAFAHAFVHPSLMEPWGLVVNEAAACSLPLLVSDRAGCVETLIPDPPHPPTGRRFDGRTTSETTAALAWMAGLPEPERKAMGDRASKVVAEWGPDRFAEAVVEAWDRCPVVRTRRGAVACRN